MTPKTAVKLYSALISQVKEYNDLGEMHDFYQGLENLLGTKTKDELLEILGRKLGNAALND